MTFTFSNDQPPEASDSGGAGPRPRWATLVEEADAAIRDLAELDVDGLPADALWEMLVEWQQLKDLLDVAEARALRVQEERG